MKILYVATISNTMFFFINFFDHLFNDGYTVDFACHIVRPIPERFYEHGSKIYNIGMNRNPLSINNLFAYKKLKRLIDDGSYDIIHCHTPIAAALTRIASREARKKGSRIIYTAHGFHFYRGAPLINWLIYYPIEKVCSYFTDVLITINHEDYERAKRKFKAKHVFYVPGVGFKTQEFLGCEIEKNAKRNELNIPLDAVVILSVGELNKNKNHEAIIRAIAELKNKDMHYVIAGHGALKNYLCTLSDKLGLKSQIHFLGLRNDVPELCKMADIFCFPSKREGLSVSLMEAMASGLPCIVSNIRGNSDLIDEGKGGYLIKATGISGFADNIKRISLDKELRLNMGNYNKEKVKYFAVENSIEHMRKIYNEIL